jgi:DNA-binding response OmpR family regulator
MNLPVIGGAEAVRLIRRSGGLSGVPIIALTAHDGEEEHLIMREAGCDDVECKPVELPRLLEKIESLLHRAGDHR